MVMFWGMFLPWGARYSCDAILTSEGHQEKAILTVATIAYLLQLCYIYTGSALLKGPEWNSEFTAMYYVYGLDQIAYPITRHLYYHPVFLKALTAVAFYFELLVPILFFIPFKHQWFRFTGVLLIILFHLLNLSTLLIGMFPLIGIATVVGMTPSFALDRFEHATGALRRRIRESFENIAAYLQPLVRWKQPDYHGNHLQQQVKSAFLIFLTVFVFDWNFSNLSFVDSKLSGSMRFIGYSLRLDQNWGMFAPGVFKDDGWFVYEGTGENNEKFNLLDPDHKLNYEKPRSVTAMFRNDRWRKYSENLILSCNSFMRGYFANYYRRIWNKEHPERKIRALEIVYMSEFTLPDYKREDPKREVLWVCN
jgi:hypothetical protein